MIIILTGPPGAGKTTVSTLLSSKFEKCLVIPVDDIREYWVRTGGAFSVDWSDETERQFVLAEDCAVDIAIRYSGAGFFVIIDHSRNLRRWDELCDTRLSDEIALRVCLLPSLETNLDRNVGRNSKSFDQTLLEPIIREMNPGMAENAAGHWIVLDTSKQSPVETSDAIWTLISSQVD